MWEGLLKREVLVDFMGFEPVFGFVEATEWFAVEGVFMGGAGKWLSDGKPELF